MVGQEKYTTGMAPKQGDAMRRRRVCPVCDRAYVTHRKQWFMHRDPKTGKVTWCRFTLLMAGKA